MILGQQLSERQMNAMMSDCMQGTCCIRKISPDVRSCGKETKGATQGLELQIDSTVSLQKQKKMACVPDGAPVYPRFIQPKVPSLQAVSHDTAVKCSGIQTKWH